MAATLTFQGSTIHSLKDLRENIEKEACLKALMDHTLCQWLSEHYYETEAMQVRSLCMEDPNCYSKLCEILSVPYEENPNFSEEEKENLAKKKQAVRDLIGTTTEADAILSQIHQVAMNQEELAKILHLEEKKIYLCNNTFSIPLSKTDREYIGIGRVCLESPFTEKQYKMAGISVKNISLPTETSPALTYLAKTAVENIGYDNYALSHSPLASRLHQELKASNLYLRYNLPNDASLAGKFFTKKSECETAKKAALQNAYTKAQAYLTPGHSKCMAKEAAEHYSQKIESSFVPFIDSLKTFCSLSERNSVFEKLSNLISHSKKNLKARFEEELNEHSDYYKLYGLEYFMEQAQIEEHDFRISEEGFFKFLETVLADNIQYTLNNIYSVILELENDLNKYAGTFSRSALGEYQRYVEEIEKLVDSLGKGLPDFIENEDINDYLRRMCTTLVK